MSDPFPTSNAATDASRNQTAPRRSGGAVGGAAVVMFAKACGLVVSFVTIFFVARILTPADYGVVSMVTSVTAFMSIFSDLGLSLVTVQRRTLSPQQSSTLFWINLGFGFVLALATIALSPLLAWFYQDPRILMVTLVMSAVFPLMTAGVQHQAHLKRDMRFWRLATVRLCGTCGGAIASVLAAYSGWGYWALVIQPIAVVGVEAIGSFLANPWLPSRPSRCEDLRRMLSFGGNLTAHGMVGYFANNLDNILIGRFWGPHQLGFYASSYQLMMRPIALAGYSVGEAAIPALSRKAHDPAAIKHEYQRMLSLTGLLGLPACFAGVFWADDLVLTMLGPQWTQSPPILQALFLAAIPRMILVSTGWIYVATGRPDRMLRWQLMWTPCVALAFVLGLPSGAYGVATAYAIVNWIGLVPGFRYCFRATSLRIADAIQPVLAPCACAILACLGGSLLQQFLWPLEPAGPMRLVIRLAIAALIFCATTAASVPLVMEMVRKLQRRTSISLPRAATATGQASQFGGVRS